MFVFAKLTSLFPLWVLLASLLSLKYPGLFTWFKGPFITWGLGVIMLGMGLTLSPKDFKGIILFPKSVFMGIVFQYSIMPALGFFLGYIFKLPTPLAVGLVLVSCCPGGTASNVISFLARANVALSVTMTSISTLLAIFLTPMLTTLLVGSRLDVNALGLFQDTLKVVLLPVALGVGLHQFFPKQTKSLMDVFPFISVAAITMIVASIIGSGKSRLLTSGISLFFAVVILHAAGFFLGYVAAYLLSRNKQTSRTISIEVGMQNSGLGAVLAKNNFTDPATALPSALSSLTHCLIGSLMASIWRKSQRE